MNFVVCSGYIQKKTEYVKNDMGQDEFRFFLNSYSYYFKEAYPIPFKIIGDKATECYAKFEVGDYLEVTGELIRPNKNSMYIMCKDISCKKPKSKKEYYIRTSEFLDFYNPERILTNLNEKNSKKGKK
jgi:hypothetical protein